MCPAAAKEESGGRLLWAATRVCATRSSPRGVGDANRQTGASGQRVPEHPGVSALLDARAVVHTSGPLAGLFCPGQ